MPTVLTLMMELSEVKMVKKEIKKMPNTLTTEN